MVGWWGELCLEKSPEPRYVGLPSAEPRLTCLLVSLARKLVPSPMLSLSAVLTPCTPQVLPLQKGPFSQVQLPLPLQHSDGKSYTEQNPPFCTTWPSPTILQVFAACYMMGHFLKSVSSSERGFPCVTSLLPFQFSGVLVSPTALAALRDLSQPVALPVKRRRELISPLPQNVFFLLSQS